jgi:methylated-DNA-[protein]-cysteine S-methyltransferase
LIAFTIFGTPIGACALAWGPGGIVGVQLPQASEARMRGRLARLHPGAEETAPPAAIEVIVSQIIGLTSGRPEDLTDAELDMRGIADFDRRAYAIARTVPPGQTITYGQIAARLGEPGAARAVGRAMGANPFPIIVPCHRVLGSDGRMGGFSADGGIVTKAKLLSIERARIDDAPLLFDQLPITVRPRKSAQRESP